MTCIQCEDALKKGLTRCPECGEILEEKVNELEQNVENKLNEDSVDEEIESTLDNMKEDIEEYTKRLRLYTMICGLIGIAFLIFVFYIIFD